MNVIAKIKNLLVLCRAIWFWIPCHVYLYLLIG